MRSFPHTLPEEILVEIMAWLPPESLIRSKCVSKTWNALIDALIKDPQFVAKHLQNSMSSTYIVFSSGGMTTSSTLELKLFNVLSDDSVEGPIRFVSEDLTSRLIPGETFARGLLGTYHCNGIFCLVNVSAMGYDTLVLFNPAIKESKRLPKPGIVGIFGIRSLGVGFGYDSRANDYKVVIFGLDRSENLRAEVYHLSTDSWRELNFDIEVDHLAPYSTAYLNGFFFWFVVSPEHMILSFDMCNEVFHTIATPVVDQSVPSRPSLRLWNESLAVIYASYGVARVSMYCQIWAMDIDCESVEGSCSWNKVFTVLGIRGPFAFRNNDFLIMKMSGDGFSSYNIYSQKFREIVFERADEIVYWSFSYVKSLVSVQERDENGRRLN